MTPETARLADETIARLIEETSRLTKQGPCPTWQPLVLLAISIAIGAAIGIFL